MPNARALAHSTALVAYEDRDALTQDLTAAIADQLREGIAARGEAVFAVSGGSTPKPLYQALSEVNLDWSKVHVVLVDERWVDRGEPGSNADFVAETLLQNKASAARFVGLKTANDRPQSGEARINAALEAVPRPFDVVVLGMGNDGHTASWFPHARGLDRALDDRSGQWAVGITALASPVTGDHLDRMTLTYRALKGSRLNILMMTGDDKRETFETALADGSIADMPVRALLHDPDFPVSIHWAP